jgi:transglutaminase-like putative cysteine protease
MTTLADRPAARTQPQAPDRAPAEAAALLAVILLLVAAALPLTRVFVGLDFLRPVIAAVLLSVGVSWFARRLGAGPITALIAAALGWLVFVGLAFLGDTLAAGVLPTLSTLGEARTLWVRGIELVRMRPAPAFAEAALLLLTVTGVWAIAHTVEGLVFRLQAPVKAIMMAMVLWIVPLAMAPEGGGWPWAVPFLGAAAALLLTSSGADLSRWGTWVEAVGVTRRLSPDAHPLAPAGTLVAGVAILLGALLAGLLPGFGDAPWYEFRNLGGSTLTSNPMVTIRSDLVAPDDRPLLRVRSTRPVYLRLTSLDLYSGEEEWTNAGIRGGAVNLDAVPFEQQIARGAPAEVEVIVQDLASAVLVPMPYQTTAVGGPASQAFQYDRSLSTFTVRSGATLQRGDSYRLRALVPQPDAAVAAAVDNRAPGDPLTALPGNIPAAVTQLARDIVSAAGAETPFEQALAIQAELQSWEYSLEPPQGHGATAMEAFINSRVGYCEQYAGTMAVMLRTLDIPTRVGVGFSPGTVTDEEIADDGSVVREYQVTQSNAHAWVEVLFPGLGWVTFEPTPRDDGNVLVPSPGDLAPARTSAEGGAEGPEEVDVDSPPQDDRDVIPTPSPQAVPGGVDGPDQPGTGGAGEQGAGRGGWLFALAGLALVLGVGAALLAGRRGADRRLTPLERVQHARTRVERVGRGLGRGPQPWETDAEWIGRLAPRSTAAPALAARTTQARYARSLPPDAAGEAERAAREVERSALSGLSGLRRSVVSARGSLSMAAAAITARVRRPRSETDGDGERRLRAARERLSRRR